jgi:hypothetical protein
MDDEDRFMEMARAMRKLEEARSALVGSVDYARVAELIEDAAFSVSNLAAAEKHDALCDLFSWSE